MEHVSLIHSVDRQELAAEIDRQAQKRGIVQKVLVQVSPAGEPQKGGVSPDELLPLLKACAGMPGLQVCGLMAVMPHTPDRQLLEGYFADMRRLFEQMRQEAIDGIRMDELSMGMSGDYDLAAKHGATLVRVGSAILGPRDYGIPQG